MLGKNTELESKENLIAAAAVALASQSPLQVMTYKRGDWMWRLNFL